MYVYKLPLASIITKFEIFGVPKKEHMMIRDSGTPQLAWTLARAQLLLSLYQLQSNNPFPT